MPNRFLVIAAAGAISATAWAFGNERATTTGKVADATGKPLEHATVLVYEAHVRKGYSIYCPTCWVDCGKHASTDGEGNYSIGGLNPDLLFKLLVVKDGYSATFIDQVDPAKGPAPTASLKTRTPTADPSQLVRGRVVDAHGSPVKDAVVEQEGVAFRGPHGIGRAFGPIDWIDLTAVTNRDGEFEIAYSKPAVEMTLNVSARGMAPKLVTERTGPDRKTITVTEGATIRGQLLKPDGKPVGDAEVGLSTYSRGAGTNFPEISIGTQEDGTFAITNVPAGRIWYLYPKMESLGARDLAGDVVPCETMDDGQDVDLGKIQLRAGYTLRGRVELNDGKPIPPDMHVTLFTDRGSDSQMAALAMDGDFEFHGLLKGVYSLGLGVKGYRLPDGSFGEVLIDRDRKQVVFRMEPVKGQ